MQAVGAVVLNLIPDPATERFSEGEKKDGE
jgi:hypothetical protein